MAQLAADACGPKKHGENCGIAFVYLSLQGMWYAECQPLKKQLDATALELQAVALGMNFLTRQTIGTLTSDTEVRIYSDTSRLFEYLAGVRVVDRHEPLMEEINSHREIMRMNGITVQFEQVMKHRREDYSLYMMADALSRHARTRPL